MSRLEGAFVNILQNQTHFIPYLYIIIEE